MKSKWPEVQYWKLELGYILMNILVLIYQGSFMRKETSFIN